MTVAWIYGVAGLVGGLSQIVVGMVVLRAAYLRHMMRTARTYRAVRLAARRAN
jgi:hypothetical protein